MRTPTRAAAALLATPVVLALTAGPALGFHCVNASKNQSAGVQVLMDPTDGEIIWVTRGVMDRIDRGLIDPETGEGFHGLIGYDLDGDEEADLSVFIVTPEGEIPQSAQDAGPPCQGITNVETWFAECMEQAEPV